MAQSARPKSGNPSFVPSRNTVILHQRLIEVPVGSTITYKELGQEIGEPINGSYPSLISARRRAQAIDNIVFDSVRGRGLKRLTAEEIIEKTTQRRRGISNAAYRGMRELDTIGKGNGNAPLSPSDEYRRAASNVVYRETIRITKESTFQGALKTVEVADATNLNVDKVLKQFLRSGKRMRVTEEEITTTTIIDENGDEIEMPPVVETPPSDEPPTAA